MSSIGNGVERVIEALKSQQSKEITESWRALRNRLDSMLISTNVLKTNETLSACRAMDNMSTAEREQHILKNWGPAYLERAKPILIQLQILENKSSE